MRISHFDEHKLGVVADDQVHDISDLVDARWRGTPYAPIDLIERWPRVKDHAAERVSRNRARPLSEVRLLPPIPTPRQLLAAPLNYSPHVSEMVTSRHAPEDLQAHHSPANLGFFVKASGSISGAADAIELPALPGRSFHHEIELGVVIGKTARALDAVEVRDHIFGYVCLLDITLRTEGKAQEERTMRKSFETFTPLGPYVTTADEIADPGGLDLRLWVNDELRQAANTCDLIVGVDELIAAASHVVTLRPGDIYATGTPDGVGPIFPGDTVRAMVEGVGHVELQVRERSW
jgi:2-keto-4-pentenoate hydratase/2-oxohepta-3-ene-1,7-dioic acid hydratase in catechol pathway